MMLQSMKKILGLICVNPLKKKKLNSVDDQKHWPASIKETTQWFTFLTNMEHTANKMQDDKRVISSLLKMFTMFEIRLSYEDEDLDTVSLKCINCKRETGLDPENSFTSTRRSSDLTRVPERP